MKANKGNLQAKLIEKKPMSKELKSEDSALFTLFLDYPESYWPWITSL